MDIYGHLWTFVMDIRGYLRISMVNVHGECPWIWTFVDICDGHPWISTDIHVCPWGMSMDIYGHLRWTSMDIFGYPWMSMENVHGYLWTFVYICDGHPWMCTKIHGCLRRMFMDI